mgnify:CR=1 FL=1
MSNPVITITMENGDVMKGELYPEIAPSTTLSAWQTNISTMEKSFIVSFPVS